MSQFEFFMTFYGLLLGLAVAELLMGSAVCCARAASHYGACSRRWSGLSSSSTSCRPSRMPG